ALTRTRCGCGADYLQPGGGLGCRTLRTRVAGSRGSTRCAPDPLPLGGRRSATTRSAAASCDFSPPQGLAVDSRPAAPPRPPRRRARAREAGAQPDRRRVFDPARAPLMRLAVFRRGQARYEIFWTFHSLLPDGPAVVVVLKDVFAFYEAFVYGQKLQLPPPRP